MGLEIPFLRKDAENAWHALAANTGTSTCSKLRALFYAAQPKSLRGNSRVPRNRLNQSVVISVVTVTIVSDFM